MSREIVALKVGRKHYRVKYRTLTPALLGRMSYGHSVIQIDDGQTNPETADTLLHEILHAIWAHRNLSDRCREERAVTELTSGLIAVFRDNPGLLQHLETLVKEAR